MPAVGAARLLGPGESDVLTGLLDPALPALARTGLAAALVMGKVRAAVAPTRDGGLAGLVAQGGGGTWILATGLGAWEPEAIAAAFDVLAADARLVVWDDAAQPAWLPGLASRGARPFERRHLLQDLSRVRHPDLPADAGLALTPWAAGPEAEAVLDALARASQDTLNGVFLTTPAPPTYDAVRRTLANAVAGEGRAFLPAASFVARRDGRPVGVVLAVAGDQPTEVILFDLLVDPAARGQGIARRLVMALQAAARAGGRDRLRFCTHGHNDPVLRLFHPEELLESERRTYGFWAADPAPA